jgi:hypothetical protein
MERGVAKITNEIEANKEGFVQNLRKGEYSGTDEWSDATNVAQR